MDQKLTKQIQDWLNAMPEQQDIVKGATMLLQLNRNKVLYNNIVRNPVKLKGKLVYELKKFAPTAQPGVIKKPEKTIPKKAKTKKNQSVRAID